MATLLAGGFVSVAASAGQEINGYGAGRVLVRYNNGDNDSFFIGGNASQEYQFDIPYSVNIVGIDIWCDSGELSYGAKAANATLSDVANAVASVPYVPADDLIDIAASQPVSVGPCKLVSVQCVAGTAIALALYDNRAASGTTLITQTMSAGDIFQPPAPINCINALFAGFTGTATFRFNLGSL